MPPLDPRWRAFVLRVAVVLAFLLVPWPGLGPTLASAFSATANVTCGGVRLASRYALHFTPASERVLPGQPNPAWHVIVAIRNTDTGATTRSAMNLRSLVYLPVAIFAALVLAARAGRPERILPDLVGFALVAGFVGLSVTLPLLDILSSDRVRAIPLGPTARSVVSTLFVATAETSIAAPVMLWILSRAVIGHAPVLPPTQVRATPA